MFTIDEYKRLMAAAAGIVSKNASIQQAIAFRKGVKDK
jgi:hypothetical protein